MSEKYKKQRNVDPEAVLNFGKVMPAAKELEEAVLGALLIESQIMEEISDILTEECFYQKQHALIWTAAKKLFLSLEPIDLLTVTEQLKRDGTLDNAGGAYYVAQLTNKVGSTANTQGHARILKMLWVKRMVIQVCANAVRDGYDPMSEPSELLTSLNLELSDLSEGIMRGSEANWQTIVQETTEQLLTNKPQELSTSPSIPTGISELDKTINGYGNGNLIVIAADSEGGKTTLALQCLWHNLRKNIPMGIMSIEMTAKEILEKLLAMEAEVPMKDIARSNLSDQQKQSLRKASQTIINWPIRIAESSHAIDLTSICSLARTWKKKYGIKGLVVDYIQLVEIDKKDNFKNRENEVSTVSRKLKQLAMQLDIPVIGLSQLNKDSKKRANKDKRPILTDLRESSGIGQDANVVIFLFRPDKNGIDYYDDNQPTTGITEIITGKNRRTGEHDTHKCKYDTLKNRFNGNYSLDEEIPF